MTLKLVTFVSHRAAQLAFTISNIGETVRLSDTSFVLDTFLTTDAVLKKLLKVVDLDDDVYVLELSRYWSGYGTAAANGFLECRMGDGYKPRTGGRIQENKNCEDSESGNATQRPIRL